MSNESGALKTYFIQAVTGGAIKIGKSINPKDRLSTLQTSHSTKLEILAVLDGDHEGELHTKFKTLRINGEWYRCENPLVDYLLQTASLSEPHRKRLVKTIQTSLSTSAEPAARPDEVPCEFVIDRDRFKTDGEFGEAIVDALYLDRGEECDCGENLEGDFEPRHLEAGCSAAIWNHAAFLLGQWAYAIERFGISDEDRILYVVTRDLKSPARRRFLEEGAPYLGFTLDEIYWGLHISAFDGARWPGVRIHDAFYLYLESLKPEEPQNKNRRPVFGDPESIRLRDWEIPK